MALSNFSEKSALRLWLFINAKNVEEAKRCGTVIVGEGGRILEFVEKPLHPKNTLVCGCVYAFPKRIGKRFKEYLALGLPTDQPGRFIEWLHKQEPVYGYMFKDYFWDIGTQDSYRAADEFFSRASL